jgi:hypothetical protein
MTRRQWLALIPAGAAKMWAADRPAFERFDTHIHIHRPVPEFTAGMEKAGWRALSICVSRATGREASILPEMLPGTGEAVQESGRRLSWAATFDARGFESSDFSERTVADLRGWFDRGAIAVKVWKNIGMAIRGRSGKYLLPDDASLLPIYEAIQRADRTLVAHLAEPDGAWLPIDEKNPEVNYYRNNPQWHMSNHPGAPSKETILGARDRVLERFPKLRLVGCHLGSNEDNLTALAKRLDTYPNFAVDCAARVRYFAAGDRETVRQFLMKYQDRITYGTDYQIRDTPADRAWSSVGTRMEEEYQYFASSETMEFRGRPARGLGLPETILRKIFSENPQRWFPGIGG